MQASKGAYIVKDVDKPDVILLANGSEVSTLFAAAQKLETEKGLKIRIVSAISEGLFRMQPESYQKHVIPDGIPVFGLTAGLPVTLKGLAGARGSVYGMQQFGLSAPYHILDEKFGFTAENICNEVLQYLETRKVH